MKIAIALKDNARITVEDLERFTAAIRATADTPIVSRIDIERDEESGHTGLIYERKADKP